MTTIGVTRGGLLLRLGGRTYAVLRSTSRRRVCWMLARPLADGSFRIAVLLLQPQGAEPEAMAGRPPRRRGRPAPNVPATRQKGPPAQPAAPRVPRGAHGPSGTGRKGKDRHTSSNRYGAQDRADVRQAAEERERARRRAEERAASRPVEALEEKIRRLADLRKHALTKNQLQKAAAIEVDLQAARKDLKALKRSLEKEQELMAVW